MGRPKKDADDAKQVDAEFVPGENGKDLPALPMRTVNLNLHTTKKYIESLMDMPAGEALEIIEKQITLKLMLINEQIIKWLEVLDGSSNWKERAEASHHIEVLTQATSRIAEQRQSLLKALGTGEGASLPENNPAPPIAPVEVSVDDFAKEYQLLNESNPK